MNVQEARTILGVDEQATTDEIRHAYRRTALECHPDKGGNAERFNRVKTAYDTLLNSESTPNDSTDHLANLFFNVCSGFNRFRMKKQLNVTVDLCVSIKDVFLGTIKKLCVKTLRGESYVTTTHLIPLYNFQHIHVFKGCGDSLINGLSGDLIVNLVAETSNTFYFDIELTGHDLHHTINVGLRDYIVGGEEHINLPDGSRIPVQLPPLFAPNTTVTIHGKGLPISDDCKHRGDLVVHLHPHVKPQNGETYLKDKQFLQKLSEYFIPTSTCSHN